MDYEQKRYIIPPDMRKRFLFAGVTPMEGIVVLGSFMLIMTVFVGTFGMGASKFLAIPVFAYALFVRLPDSDVNGRIIIGRVLRYFFGQQMYSLKSNSKEVYAYAKGKTTNSRLDAVQYSR